MDNFIPMPPQENVAAVSPQTEVILASGIEWGNDYEHVRYYENGKAGCLAHVREKAIHIFKQSAPVRWGEINLKTSVTQPFYARHKTEIPFFRIRLILKSNIIAFQKFALIPFSFIRQFSPSHGRGLLKNMNCFFSYMSQTASFSIFIITHMFIVISPFNPTC